MNTKNTKTGFYPWVLTWLKKKNLGIMKARTEEILPAAQLVFCSSFISFYSLIFFQVVGS